MIVHYLEEHESFFLFFVSFIHFLIKDIKSFLESRIGFKNNYNIKIYLWFLFYFSSYLENFTLKTIFYEPTT